MLATGRLPWGEVWVAVLQTCHMSHCNLAVHTGTARPAGQGAGMWHTSHTGGLGEARLNGLRAGRNKRGDRGLSTASCHAVVSAGP